MSDQIDKVVYDVVNKSGYPLEMEVSALLDDKWEVENTSYYYDFDENKGRDIDIVARYKEDQKSRSK